MTTTFDPRNRLSLDSVMAVAHDVVESEAAPLRAVGIIPSQGDTAYVEVVFAPDAESRGRPVSVGVSRWESPERLRARLVTELRGASSSPFLTGAPGVRRKEG